MGAPEESKAGDKGIRSEFKMHIAGCGVGQMEGQPPNGVHSFIQ